MWLQQHYGKEEHRPTRTTVPILGAFPYLEPLQPHGSIHPYVAYLPHPTPRLSRVISLTLTKEPGSFTQGLHGVDWGWALQDEWSFPPALYGFFIEAYRYALLVKENDKPSSAGDSVIPGGNRCPRLLPVPPGKYNGDWDSA